MKISIHHENGSIYSIETTQISGDTQHVQTLQLVGDYLKQF